MVQIQEIIHGADPVDNLQAHGISKADIDRLKDAGLCNIESVACSPREVLQIHGFGEALIDQIIEAAFTLMTSSDNTSQPRDLIISGSCEHEKALRTDEGTYLPELPTEIWSDILLMANLPCKTLADLCTNKTLKSAISSEYFVSKFIKKDGLELIVQGSSTWEFHLYNVENNEWRDIAFAREDLRNVNICIVGACKGLVLAVIPLKLTTLYLWNVSLNIVRDQPLPLPTGVEKKNADVMGFGVGYRSSDDQYEVVCIFNVNWIQVFNLTSKSWRSVILETSETLHLKSSYGLFLKGSLFWCLDNWKGVLEYNLESEMFTIRLLPKKKSLLSDRSLR